MSGLVQVREIRQMCVLERGRLLVVELGRARAGEEQRDRELVELHAPMLLVRSRRAATVGRAL
jgi:hypothetical protein